MVVPRPAGQDRRRLTVSMPDARANQAAYPYRAQERQLGFPSPASCGLQLGRGHGLGSRPGTYQGEETGELALLRQIIGQFQPGDIALATALRHVLGHRGMAGPGRGRSNAAAPVPHGRLPARPPAWPDDHVVTWSKPQDFPDLISRAEYRAMPAKLTVREVRLRVQDKSKRIRNVVLVTTLRDATLPRGGDPRLVPSAAEGSCRVLLLQSRPETVWSRKPASWPAQLAATT